MSDRIALVTDSTVDLPLERRKELGITMVPLQLDFEGQTYNDWVDLDPADFYERYRSSDSLATTSQPAPQAFKEVYSRLLDEGREIISIHLSSAISGTHQSATLALKALGSDRIHLVDSRQGSIGATLIAWRAANAIAKGMDVEGVLKQVDDAIDRTMLFFCVEELTYLHKGGRIGLASQLLGSMINIKPILNFKNGLIAPWAKVRGDKQVDSRILTAMEAQVKGPIDVAWVHAANSARVETLVKKVRERFEVRKEFGGCLGAVIGSHVGPGAWGIAFQPVVDLEAD